MSAKSLLQLGALFSFNRFSLILFARLLPGWWRWPQRWWQRWWRIMLPRFLLLTVIDGSFGGIFARIAVVMPALP